MPLSQNMRPDYTGHTPNSALQYRQVSQQSRLSLSDTFLIFRYHLKVFSSWLLGLIGFGFGTCAIILWLQLKKGDAESLGNAAQLSLFVLESGAGLVAGLLASSLLIGDPLLEIMMVTSSGIGKVAAIRLFLSFGLLMVYSTLYLVWSLINGVVYAKEQGLLFFLLLWLAPVATVGMLAFFCSLITRNSALGLVIGLVPLAGALFLQPYLLLVEQLHPFIISYTLAGYNAPDWWLNRLTLLAIGLGLAGLNGWILRKEERLLVG